MMSPANQGFGPNTIQYIAVPISESAERPIARASAVGASPGSSWRTPDPPENGVGVPWRSSSRSK